MKFPHSILYSLWRIENVDIDVKRGIKVAMSVPRQNAVIASFRSLSIHQKQVGTFGANPSFRGHLRQPPLVLDLRRIPWGIEANVQGFTFYHSVRRIAFWRIESWFIWKNLIFFLNFWSMIFNLPIAYFESVKVGPAIFLQCYQLYRKFNLLKRQDSILLEKPVKRVFLPSEICKNNHWYWLYVRGARYITDFDGRLIFCTIFHEDSKNTIFFKIGHT